jgi:hypothetical protein
VPCGDPLLRLLHGLHLGLPSDKAGEPAGGGDLQAAAQGAGPGQLEHLDRVREALHRDGPQGDDLHQPFDQPQGGGGEADGPRGRRLFHPRGQDRRLPHGRVVHIQVVANGPHHHLPRVEAHAHAQLQTAGAAHLLSVGLHAACMARAA